VREREREIVIAKDKKYLGAEWKILLKLFLGKVVRGQ